MACTAIYTSFVAYYVCTVLFCTSHYDMLETFGSFVIKINKILYDKFDLI